MPLDLESSGRVRIEDVKALLDHLAEGVVVFDRQGRILSINRAACRLLEDPDQGPGATAELIRELSSVASSAMAGDASSHGRPDRDAKGHLTADAIEESLSIAGWNIAAAARRLGVSRTAFYKRIRALGLDRFRQPR
jgi:transcriptional regulator of acetoin/glycerol metabolism